MDLRRHRKQLLKIREQEDTERAQIEVTQKGTDMSYP